jgi:biotin carboxylase
VDRVEALGEYQMLLAARIREALHVPGLTVAQTVPFRDKEEMKRRLDAAGLRTPRHFKAGSESEILAAAERVGFPLIIKPIAGAGSANTYRIDDNDQLYKVLPKLRGVAEVSVEEFIDGEEFTFDTLTAGGQIQYYNVAWYRPRPLQARSHEWISPQVIALRYPDQAALAAGVDLGRKVIAALGFDSGFTHMEWYRKADGEVVFGEIGARPPGARQVDQMNYACDFDSFREWARVVVHGQMQARIERKYNVATVFKRAQGQGRIVRIDGMEQLRREFGPYLVWDNLLPVGAQRRNWLQTLLSDGFVVVRHPDLQVTCEMADRIGQEVQLYARP